VKYHTAILLKSSKFVLYKDEITKKAEGYTKDILLIAAK